MYVYYCNCEHGTCTEECSIYSIHVSSTVHIVHTCTIFTRSDIVVTVLSILRCSVLFKSSDYSEAAFILLSQSLFADHRREQSSIISTRQERNLLVVTD